MKRSTKRILQSIFVNNVAWAIAFPFVYIGKRLELSRANYLNSKNEDANAALCKNIFKDQQVRRGLFKGLQLNNIEATGSSTYAKLLGSYELELAPVLESLLKKQYGYFVNVGCDEGYYAVGIAKAIPQIKVVAFDCYRPAQKKCKALAAINDVAERVTVKGCFEVKQLSNISKEQNVLFIIDCEGCEDNIIDEQLVAQFPSSDFIVELHYEVAPMILSQLQNIFKATHTIAVVKALSDHEKVMQYGFPELHNLSYQQKDFILAERESYTEWFIATAVK